MSSDSDTSELLQMNSLDRSSLLVPIGDRPQMNNQYTISSVVVGLVAGCILCFSNTYFGLQTGFVTMGSLQSTIIGYAVFKILLPKTKFGPKDNVLLQTVAVATASVPLAAGFVGILPALALMTEEDNNGIGPMKLGFFQLVLWTISLAFFGAFFAVPLRKQVIVKEKLKFPSGTATAEMIRVLHESKKEGYNISNKSSTRNTGEQMYGIHLEDGIQEITSISDCESCGNLWRLQLNYLLTSFALSACHTILSYFLPVLHNIPVGNIVGVRVLTVWGWTFTPSLSYIGQGMIMGTRSGLSMLLGSIIGYMFIGPISYSTATVGSVKEGKDLILWVSLAVMMSDSITSLVFLIIKSIKRIKFPSIAQFLRSDRGNSGYLEHQNSVMDNIDKTPSEYQVPTLWWTCGLTISCIVCLSIFSFEFDISILEGVVALLLAALVSVLAVRALGETDLNPTSGVGKVAQLIFSLVAPRNMVANIIAGGIAEAGAMQAGDMMQDLKTGYLLDASPRVQFFGQILGSAVSVIFSIAAYMLYTSVYEIPSSLFPVPTAKIWLDMARVVTGEGLDHTFTYFCVFGGLLGFTLAILYQTLSHGKRRYVPSGIAMAVGMYVTPNWTIARVIGAVGSLLWNLKHKGSHSKFMIVVASGFVLGEGLFAILTALFKSLGVPILSCIGCAQGLCDGCPI